MSDCLFCRLAAGDIPSTRVADSDDAMAFRDINPVAPDHVLVIPKVHIGSLAELDFDRPEHARIWIEMSRMARAIADDHSQRLASRDQHRRRRRPDSGPSPPACAGGSAVYLAAGIADS